MASPHLIPPGQCAKFMGSARQAGSRAFTLIETVLAIGIVSFAFVAIMGLLPCGLQVFRKAMDATLEGQIVQHVVGEISQTAYDKIPVDFQGKTFWFDGDGNSVTEQNADGIYRASVALDSQPALPGTMSLSQGNLTGVTITFQRKNETGPVGASKTFVTYVAAKSRPVSE